MMTNAKKYRSFNPSVKIARVFIYSAFSLVMTVSASEAFHGENVDKKNANEVVKENTVVGESLELPNSESVPKDIIGLDVLAMVKLTQQIASYQANYEQKITDQFGNIKDRAKGYFTLQKPYQFIWQTSEPYEQKIVSDGVDLWTYDLDLEQVNVQTLDTALGSTPAFLIGSDAKILSETFNVQRLPSGNANVDTFELTPKDLGQAFERLLLLFKDEQLVEILMFDTLGQRTVVSFTQVKTNQTLASDTFKFVVPNDVDLMDSRQTPSHKEALSRDTIEPSKSSRH